MSKDSLLVIVLGLFLVVIGNLIDIIVRKNELENINAVLNKWAERLRNVPIRDWQIAIAEFGVNFFSYSPNQVNSIFESTNRPSTTYYVFRFFFIGRNMVFLPMFAFFIFFFIFIHIKMGFVNPFSIKRPEDWYLSFLLFIFFLFVLRGLFSSIYRRYDLIILGNRTISSIMVIFCIVTTFLAFLATQKIPYLNELYWFESVDNILVPSKLILMGSLNIIFDLATIIISLILLQIVITHRRFFITIALIDLAISGVLTILLYSVFKLVENGYHLNGFIYHIYESALWLFTLLKIIIFGLINRSYNVDLSKIKDLHLIPILFTSFIPVTIYVSTIIFLSISKPIMWISSRIFETEKSESVFKQFASLIAVFMALVKAAFDYFTYIP